MTENTFTGLDQDNRICYCYMDFGSSVTESSKDICRMDVSTADRNDLSEEEWQELAAERSHDRETVKYHALTEYVG